MTFFTIPKAFTGHVGIIQRNAIQSWTRLQPKPEIILLGNDAGTAELACELGLKHIPQIKLSDHGTPLLSEMFRQAEGHATSEWLCYINADIILLSDFAAAFEAVRRQVPKFLMVSKRVNIDISEALDFEPGWESAMRSRRDSTGRDGHYSAIDIFVFLRGTYTQIPDFAIGRLWFDQWLIKDARRKNLPVVDTSLIAPVIHQNHDYNHVTGGEAEVWRGQEAARNFILYGSVAHAYTLIDATHELNADGSINRVPFRKLLFKLKQVIWEIFVLRTASWRAAIGLHRKFKRPKIV